MNGVATPDAPSPDAPLLRTAGERRAVRLAALSWMALIFLLSSRAGPSLAAEPLLDLALKKGGHLVLYLVLAVLVALVVDQTRWRRAAVPAAVLIAIAFAASDELHQVFTPTRTPLLTDIVIDAAGAALGVLAYLWLRRRADRLAAGRGPVERPPAGGADTPLG